MAVECPVCTLFLRSGMSMEEHLDTHPKEKVIKTLATIALRQTQPEPQPQQPVPPQPQQPVPPQPSVYAEAMHNPVSTGTDTSGAAPTLLPRYTNERYSGPPPPYNSHRAQQQQQMPEPEPQQQAQQPQQQQNTRGAKKSITHCHAQSQRATASHHIQLASGQTSPMESIIITAPAPVDSSMVASTSNQALTTSTTSITTSKVTYILHEGNPRSGLEQPQASQSGEIPPSIKYGFPYNKGGGSKPPWTKETQPKVLDLESLQAFTGRAVTIQRIDKNDGRRAEEGRPTGEIVMLEQDPNTHNHEPQTGTSSSSSDTTATSSSDTTATSSSDALASSSSDAPGTSSAPASEEESGSDTEGNASSVSNFNSSMPIPDASSVKLAASTISTATAQTSSMATNTSNETYAVQKAADQEYDGSASDSSLSLQSYHRSDSDCYVDDFVDPPAMARKKTGGERHTEDQHINDLACESVIDLAEYGCPSQRPPMAVENYTSIASSSVEFIEEQQITDEMAAMLRRPEAGRVLSDGKDPTVVGTSKSTPNAHGSCTISAGPAETISSMGANTTTDAVMQNSTDQQNDANRAIHPPSGRGSMQFYRWAGEIQNPIENNLPSTSNLNPQLDTSSSSNVSSPRSFPTPLATNSPAEQNTNGVTTARKRTETVRVLSDVKVTAPLSECYKDVILNLKSKKLPLSIGDRTSLIRPSLRRSLPPSTGSEPSGNGQMNLSCINELVLSPASYMPPIDFGQVQAIEIRNDGDEEDEGGLDDTSGHGEREVTGEHDADASEESIEHNRRRKRRNESRPCGTKRTRATGAKDCYTGNLSLNVQSVSMASTSHGAMGLVARSPSQAASSSTGSSSSMVTSVIRMTPHPSSLPSPSLTISSDSAASAEQAFQLPEVHRPTMQGTPPNESGRIEPVGLPPSTASAGGELLAFPRIDLTRASPDTSVRTDSNSAYASNIRNRATAANKNPRLNPRTRDVQPVGTIHPTSAVIPLPVAATSPAVAATHPPVAAITSPVAVIPSPVVAIPSPVAAIPSPVAAIPSPVAAIPTPNAITVMPRARGVPSRNAKRSILPFKAPRRMRQTARASTARPSGKPTAVVAAQCEIVRVKDEQQPSDTSGDDPNSANGAPDTGYSAPLHEPAEFRIRYRTSRGEIFYENVPMNAFLSDYLRQEGIVMDQCTITRFPHAEINDNAQIDSSPSIEMEDLPMVYMEGHAPEEEQEANGEEINDDEEAEEEEEEDDQEDGDEQDETGTDNDGEDGPDERPPDADGSDGQGEPQNQQHQDDQHQKKQDQDRHDRNQQKRRGQSKRQRNKKDDGFQSQEDEELTKRNRDSHGLATVQQIKQEHAQGHEQHLSHASLVCFEMEAPTAVAEIEVESEVIDRKPSEQELTSELDGDEGTVSSVSSFSELPLTATVKVERRSQCRSRPKGTSKETHGKLAKPADERDFFEAGPSKKPHSRHISGTSTKHPHGGHQPMRHLQNDDKDFLEAGPSSRAALPTKKDRATRAKKASHAYTQRSAFQRYECPNVFHTALSPQVSSASGTTTPTGQDGIPISWARKFSPQYSSAALAASGGLLDGGDDSAEDDEAAGTQGGQGSFRRGYWRFVGNESSPSEPEVILRERKKEDTKPDTSKGLDDEGERGSGGKVGDTACGEAKDPANRHSSVSSIGSSSMERAPSTESLNIRTDEKMPAKGEISEQESNGDMESSWNRLRAVRENVPIYPSSYDLSTAQECWNLSSRNQGRSSATITGESGGARPFFPKAAGSYNSYRSSRPPFTFSSASQTLLSDYRVRDNAGRGACKNEDDDQLDNEGDEDGEHDEDEEEENDEMERPASIKRQVQGGNTESHQRQKDKLPSTAGASFGEGMPEEKYSPAAAGTSHFAGVVSSAHAMPMEAQAAKPATAVMRMPPEPKPSGSGISRTYRCTKCLKTFNSIKQRKEHQHQEHPGDAQQQPKEHLQHVAKQEHENQFAPQLLASCELGEELKEGILKDKPPAPAQILPTIMNDEWLRMEILRKHELSARPSNELAEVPVATVVHRRSFVCPICFSTFERFNLFNTHLSMHPAQCVSCGRYFKQWRNFALHLKRHLGIKEHGCRVCGKHFVIKQKLIEHMRVHTGQAPIRCKLCNRQFKRFSNLAQHCNRYHLNKPAFRQEYVCTQCGDVFRTRAKMEWHKETHDPKPKPCPYCREKFIHQNSLTRHIRLSHTDKYAALENKTEPCTVCQQPYTKASMRRHMETHAEGRLVFSCSICNKHFTTNWNLKQHKWTHANPTMKPFQCTICPSGFVRESDYLTHVNSHRSIRPYTCNYCGRQFIRKYNWLRHSREHETDKGHNCEVCGRQFHRKYYLTEHKRIHTGERPFTCNICGKTSSTKTNHNKHLRIHHARDPLTAEG